MFGFRVTEKLQGRAEGQAFEESGNSILPVSLGTGLLLIGGQISGFFNPEIQNLITDSSGPNIKEFFGSRVCPLCFPSSEEEESATSEKDDDDDDDDENDYAYDPDEQEQDRPVRVLRVTPDNGVSSLIVNNLKDMKEKSGIDSDFDSWYLRDLGVYFWYDGYAQQKKLPLNAFCSVLAGSGVRGNVMIIGDITKSLRRTSDWQDLPEGWLQPPLARVIEIVNSDQQIISMLMKALSK
jgi:hypothetical protein